MSISKTIFSLIAAGVSLSAVALAQGGAKGKVRAVSGKGISGASVTARQDGKDIRTVKADNKGEFELTGLRPGVYSFVFDADGFQTGLLQGIEVKDGKVQNLGDRLILRPDQGMQVVINGSVYYKEGVSLGGAKIQIERVNADGTTKKVTTLYTNIQGEFTFRQPQQTAKFKITASYKGAEGVHEIEVDTAAIYRFALTLDVSRTVK